MKFRHQQDRHELPELEITPMLNVMLVVLAFFVAVAANLAEEGASLLVRLPQEAETTEAQAAEVLLDKSEEPEFLQVVLHPGGKLSVNDRPVEKVQLLQRLPNYLQQSPQHYVYLQVSGDVPYQSAIEILSSLKEVGGDRVSLLIGTGAVP
ncbi:biopolymer transporter ExbD [Synechocystis salina LEGE 06155]|nr:biopolymer transporter ExbD [Synechocystis salina LEGE 06155]